jgi:hypothetical protein
MDKFDKLLEKKGKKLSDVEQRAKSDVLSGFQSEGSDSMADKLAGLKKVSVAAPDKEGLKAGLEKAEEFLEGGEEMGEDLDSKPMEECSVEEIDQKIQKLMDYKQELLQKEQE